MILSRSKQLIFLYLLLGGCDNTLPAGEELSSFYFSNTTPSTQSFLIDEFSIRLNNNEIEEIKLLPGEHKLIKEDGQELSFLIFPGNSGGIINPNGQIFYSFTAVYANEPLKSHIHTAKNSFVFDNKEYIGAVLSSDAIFIDNNIFQCSYSINEDFPSIAENNGNMIHTKCFTEPQFRQFLSTNPQGIEKVVSATAINLAENSISTEFNYDISNIIFEDNELNKQANSINQLIRQYRELRDISKKHEYYDIYHEHLMIMAKIYRKAAIRQSKNENLKFNQYLQQTGAIFGAGILPIEKRS